MINYTIEEYERLQSLKEEEQECTREPTCCNDFVGSIKEIEAETF